MNNLEQKIIDRLAELFDDNVDSETGEACNNWVVDMQNQMISECIRIVVEEFNKNK